MESHCERIEFLNNPSVVSLCNSASVDSCHNEDNGGMDLCEGGQVFKQFFVQSLQFSFGSN